MKNIRFFFYLKTFSFFFFFFFFFFFCGEIFNIFEEACFRNDTESTVKTSLTRTPMAHLPWLI